MSSKEQYLKVTFESFSNYLTSFKKNLCMPNMQQYKLDSFSTGAS